jgi:hypothetical protein
VKKRSAGPAAAPKVTEITNEKLRELRQLCHPDRHNNSPLSVRVSHWLNEVGQELDNQKKGA